MNKKIFFALLLFIPFSFFAQDAITQQESGANLDVLYRNEITGALIIHSQGMGINVRRGQHETAKKTRILEFDLVSMRHPKEVKTVNAGFPSSKGFYYGKLNSLLILRAGIGYQKVIFGKAKKERKSVEIRYGTFIGPSIGLAKPVYLEILKSTYNPYEFDISTERYDPNVHSLDDIYGKAPYSKGFDKMKFYPGGYAKFGLSVEYADMHNDVKAIETGIVLDAYPKAIPMMATEKIRPLLFTLYINVIYGKKWF